MWLIESKKRLSLWQCDNLSSGGKTVLINSRLSSIPMYTVGVYILYEGIYQALDSARSKFFWQGMNKKRKYHMVKWEALNRPKYFGGLGFTDVRVMNTCLVAKWFARLEANDLSICCELLRKKYLGNKSIFQIKRISGSQFWRGLLSTRQWFQWGRVTKVKSGQQTRF